MADGRFFVKNGNKVNIEGRKNNHRLYLPDETNLRLCFYEFYLALTLKFIIFVLDLFLIKMNKSALNRIKVVLVENQKTSKWLAEQLGVSAVTVSKWCTNMHQPDLQTLAKIADLIGCEKRELITE